MTEEQNPVQQPEETTQAETHVEAKPETDWKTEARKWESRAKENKEAADELAKLKEAEKTELEKERAAREKAEQEASALKHEKELADWRSQVAKETNLPGDILRGDTLEEIQAHAAQIKSCVPAYPVVDEGSHEPSSKLTKEQILQEKDERVRKGLIASNLDLF